MPHQPETIDLLQWHKFFAMEYNNKAWDLAAKPDRSNAENDCMLDAAHTAAAHWKAVGTDLHIARAEMLLAAVHALLGFGESAWPLALRVKNFFSTTECPDWERAYISLIYAHAAILAGNQSEYTEAYQQATADLDAIADPEDRKLVQASFDQVPRPE